MTSGPVFKGSIKHPANEIRFELWENGKGVSIVVNDQIWGDMGLLGIPSLSGGYGGVFISGRQNTYAVVTANGSWMDKQISATFEIPDVDITFIQEQEYIRE